MASTTLHHAAKSGDLAEIGRFLSIEADVNEVDKLQRTPLHLAAWAGHVEAVRALLAASGVRVKAKAIDDMTALHFAAQNGHTEVARLLITAGIPVNSKTRKMATALHYACQKGHKDTVELLLARKGSPFMQNKKGEDALALCTDDSIRALVQAAIDAGTDSAQLSGRKRQQRMGAGAISNAADAGSADEDDAIALKKTSAVQRPPPAGGAAPSNAHARSASARPVPASGPLPVPASGAAHNTTAAVRPRPAPASGPASARRAIAGADDAGVRGTAAMAPVAEAPLSNVDGGGGSGGNAAAGSTLPADDDAIRRRMGDVIECRTGLDEHQDMVLRPGSPAAANAVAADPSAGQVDAQAVDRPEAPEDVAQGLGHSEVARFSRPAPVAGAASGGVAAVTGQGDVAPVRKRPPPARGPQG